MNMIMNVNNICLNTNKTVKTKNILYSWLYDINPQFFLTIQFPKHIRSSNLLSSNKNLLNIMLNFERLLLGRHWNRKHIPFIAIAEQGKSINWHYHIYIYDCPFNYFKIQSVINDITDKMNLTQETLHIQPVLTSGAYSYTSKEIITDKNNHFDTDRIITSEMLFDIAHKNKK